MLAALTRRLSWINLPGVMLLALLQRTPALRVLAVVEERIVASPVGTLLRSAVGAVASLGAMHSLAGATVMSASANPVRGTTGTAITPVAIAVTGAPTPAGSYRIVSGTLPPGLTLVNATSAGYVNALTATITGTPTVAGSYSVRVRAWEFINGGGDAFPALPGFLLSFEIAQGVGTPPAITSQPSSQSATLGGSVVLTVAASGTAPFSYQWLKDGTAIAGATNATLNLTAIQASSAGSYTVVVTNASGSVTSSAAVITINLPPTIATDPASQIVPIGANATFSVAASGTGTLSYQWRKDGTLIPGATAASLTIPNAQLANAGNYDVIVANSFGSATSAAAILNVGPTSRINNVSVRTNLSANEIVIVGLVMQGGSKTVLVRAVGPGLVPYGVTGAMADPKFTVFNGAGTAVANNDNWGGNATIANTFASVGAFPLPDTSADAAIVRSLDSNNTIQVSGPTAGTVLVEAYDAAAGNSNTIRLTNVSARNFVGTGENVMIAGFFISGTGNKNVLIRAVGPSLAQYGVNNLLADPLLQIFDGTGKKVAENDTYAATLVPVFKSVGAFDLNSGSKDAALIVSLPAGSYTAQVSGADGGTGNAIVELYELP